MSITPTATQRQREYRANLKRRGYKRLDVVLSPKIYERLKPYLEPYKVGCRGAAVAALLEACIVYWDSLDKP